MKSIFTYIKLLVLVLCMNASANDTFTVYFGFDEHTLSVAEKQKFTTISDKLAAHSSITLEIDGYCDDLGTADYNTRLSRKRAKEIKKLLLAHGLSRNQIRRIIPHGEVQLRGLDDVERERSQNRRVEIRIISGSSNAVIAKKSVIEKSKNVDFEQYNEIDAIKNLLNNELTVEPEQEEVPEKTPVQIVEPIIEPAQDQNLYTPEEIADDEANLKNNDYEILTIMRPEESLTMDKVKFRGGTDKLGYISEKEVKKLADVLMAHPEMVVAIYGHVCCARFGMDGINSETGKRTLSEDRAKKVYQTLLAYGVKKSQISYEGKKSKEPLGGNAEDDRRVEIHILSK